MVSKTTIQRLRAVGMDWLGRLPARFLLCDELKTRAWAQAPDQWQCLGALASVPGDHAAVYQVQTFDVPFLNAPARFCLVFIRVREEKRTGVATGISARTGPGREIDPERGRENLFQPGGSRPGGRNAPRGHVVSVARGDPGNRVPRRAGLRRGQPPAHACIWPNRNGQFGHRFSPVWPLIIPQNGH